MSKYKFIDLFAGLGGFHLALEGLGHECVFASELQPDLQKLYSENYPGTPIFGDITKISVDNIPKHDILCGGFPCQPFSQAGKRLGFTEDRGNLFNNIMEILEFHKPKYVFLENVQNLKNHDEGNTWKVIEERLSALYDVKEAILSPHQFGIPQHRFRIYIVGKLKEFYEDKPLANFEFPLPEKHECNIKTIIDESALDFMHLRNDTRNHLSIWQEFLNELYDNGGELPTFPIWAMEFGADYDFEDIAPAHQKLKELKNKKGKLGKKIVGSTIKECLSHLPIYAITDKTKTFPSWKIQFIKRNREFYNTHKLWLDKWIPKIVDFENSHQKFEWNCGAEENPTIYNKIIQFRPSGIRVKKPTYSPALVLTTTQIPIFPWIKLPEESLDGNEGLYGRYMTKDEAAKLQGMDKLKKYPETVPSAFKAFGNAVNVDLVKLIAEKLLNHESNRESIHRAAAQCL
ncbi:DNA (cytosine-5-)-methyltransferase [Chryseobacterium sp. S0630]|uniref:DNA cytosine methyltransferase n=1 Tax=Chryseobacterium sp. S0630 TaxID=2957803 RepID=UPI00209E3E08|nr:DNA (cytosine-5-)-methyltransferase [Chryseobacterium sp. S0630]